jgi:hypothetical protein
MGRTAHPSSQRKRGAARAAELERLHRGRLEGAEREERQMTFRSGKVGEEVVGGDVA